MTPQSINQPLVMITTEAILSPVAMKPAVTRFTRHFPTIARFLLGLPLVVFGVNAFWNFIPPPTTPLPEGAQAFIGALANTGYMFQLIGATHLIVGVLLLLNRFVPLALTLLAPFLVNSVLFHLYLERSGLLMALTFLVLEIYLLWSHRSAFRSMLAPRTARD